MQFRGGCQRQRQRDQERTTSHSGNCPGNASCKADEVLLHFGSQWGTATGITALQQTDDLYGLYFCNHPHICMHAYKHTFLDIVEVIITFPHSFIFLSFLQELTVLQEELDILIKKRQDYESVSEIAWKITTLKK